MINPVIHGYRRDIPVIEGHLHMERHDSVLKSIVVIETIMSHFGYTGVSILSIPHSGKGPDITRNIKALYAKKCLEGRVYASAGIIHSFDERDNAESFEKQAEVYYKAGFDGYKLLDGKPMLRKKIGKRLDDPIYRRFYAFAEETGMPIVMHVADPPHFWDRSQLSEYELNAGWFCDSTFPSKEELRDEVFGILKRFPRLKLTLAHMGFFSNNIDTAERFLENYENTAFDLTPNSYELEDFDNSPDIWRSFFKKYQKRILYGTDTYDFDPGNTPAEEMYGQRINLLRSFLETDREVKAPRKIVRGFALDKGILTDIYSGNHYRRYGKVPKKPDEHIMKKMCEELFKAPLVNTEKDLFNNVKYIYESQ